MRDLKGYGQTPPDPKWPGGARVAVSFVINFEEGAEMSLSQGDAFNEKVYEVTDEVVGVVADRQYTRAAGRGYHRQHLRDGGTTVAMADRGCRETRP